MKQLRLQRHLLMSDINLWTTADHALGYLASSDTIPHRTEGEAVLLKLVPPDATRILDLGFLTYSNLVEFSATWNTYHPRHQLFTHISGKPSVRQMHSKTHRTSFWMWKHNLVGCAKLGLRMSIVTVRCLN